VERKGGGPGGGVQVLCGQFDGDHQVRCFFFVALLNVDSFCGDRNEIASCEETAYESLPLKDAATLLFFTNRSELLIFAQQVDLTRINECLHTNISSCDCSAAGK
jgi:hypothetical protein